MNKEQVEKYIIEELDSTPRHDCNALADAITEVANEVETCSYKLMKLLLSNTPIDELHTHSYGFHTANGRGLINAMQEKYNESKNFFTEI